MATWPTTTHELIRLQQALGEMTPERWQPPTTMLRFGACFVCFERAHGAGAAGDRGIAGAAVTHRRRLLAGVTSSGPAGGPYLPTLLALREGPLLEQARPRPAGHPQGAGGQCHRPRPSPPRRPRAASWGLLGLPTVGVTTRPLVAQGAWPADQRAATAPLRWVARWSATGSGPGRGPGRWRSMPPGRPTPRMRSRWCWPRPVVLGPQSPCAAPAPWPEPGGHTRAERCDARAGLLFAARLLGGASWEVAGNVLA
jgi:deoxyribonuclease V